MLALAATPAAARSADWQIFESTNMWDDSPLIGAGTERDNNILMVKCDKAKQSLFVLVQLGWLDIGFGERDIMWRVDDGPAIRAAWDQMDAGGASTFGKDAWKFARAIAKAQRRILIGNETRHEEFSAVGSTSTVLRVLRDCNVTP